LASKPFPGRYTAHTGEPFVIFLIGMRVNRLFALRKWIFVFFAFARMLRDLYPHPEKGFLGGRTVVCWRGVNMIQYWRSYEDLETWARSQSELHLPAWRRYNKWIGSDNTVGVWHETYLVEPGRYEAIYDNMPVFGLASVMQHIPATGRRETARRRLGGQNEPAVPSPPQPVSSPAPAVARSGQSG
jgi:hypothetical protein